MINNAFPEYTTEYKEACFYAWYEAGRPHLNGIVQCLPEAPGGGKPSSITVRKWMNGGDGWENWKDHADRLDDELRQKLDKSAIKKRAKMVEELAEHGQKLIEIGMEYLEGEEPFKDNPAAAVRAVTQGIEIKFKYTGIGESLLAISQMSPKQLETEALRLLGKNAEIITVESEDIVNDDPEPENDND